MNYKAKGGKIMAITKCPNCNCIVSTDAEKCIHCGYTYKVCPECLCATDVSSQFCEHCGVDLNKARQKALPKYCVYCGNKLGDGTETGPIHFCVHCGAKVEETKSAEKKEAESRAYERFAPEYQSVNSEYQPSTESPIGYNYQIDNLKKATLYSGTGLYSMKWHGFMKVILWFGIVSNFMTALMSLTGLTWLGYADGVYDAIPGMQTLDIFTGLFAAAMGVYGIIVWNKLRHFKAHAPLLLTLLYVASVSFNFLSSLIMTSMINNSPVNTVDGGSYTSGQYMYEFYLDLNELAFGVSDVITIAIGVTFMIINIFYYKKRSSMFVG